MAKDNNNKVFEFSNLKGNGEKLIFGNVRFYILKIIYFSSKYFKHDKLRFKLSYTLP